MIIAVCATIALIRAKIDADSFVVLLAMSLMEFVVESVPFIVWAFGGPL